MNSKIPGNTTDMRPVNMDFSYGSSFGVSSPEAYERLILDALLGDSTLYTRRDEIETSWAFITRILRGWEDDRRPPAVLPRRKLRTGGSEAPAVPRRQTMEEAVKSPFDPIAVERELELLQRKLSPAETRTTLFNLVLFTGPGDAARSDRMLLPLLGKRPARVIHIFRDPRKEDSTIEVSARCFPDYEQRGVCFQDIIITDGRDGTGSDPGSWAPLLIRNIPVFLWWADELEPFPALLGQALEHADKLLVDSDITIGGGGSPATGTTASGPATHVRICRSLSRVVLPRMVPVSDLAWRRTVHLRRITAQAFDPEELRESLPEISSIDIEGGPAAENYLYLLWLASRLGWTSLLECASGYIARKEDGGEVSISARSSDREDPKLIRFTFRTGGELLLSRIDGASYRVIPPGDDRYVLPYSRPAEGQLILDEVDTPFQDRIYLDALALCGTE